MADVRYAVSVDASGAVTSIQKLDDAWDKLGNQHKETARSGEKVGGVLGGLWKQFAIGQLAISALHKGWSIFKGLMEGSVKGAIESEDAQVALAVSLERMGAGAKAAQIALTAFAKEQQKSTIYTDEQVMAVSTFLAQLTRLDTAGLKRATTGVIGLAAVMHTDLAGAMGYVQKAMEGNYGALGRIGIKIDESLPRQERNAQLLDMLAKLYGRATAEAGTFGGSLTVLKNMWDEVGEGMGAAIVNNERVRDLIGEVKDKIVDLIASGKLDEWADRAAKSINLIIGAFDVFMGTVDRLAKGGQVTEWLAGFISGATKAEQEYIVAGKALILSLQMSLKFVKLNSAETARALEQGTESWSTYAARMQEIDAQLARERAMPRLIPNVEAGAAKLELLAKKAFDAAKPINLLEQNVANLAEAFSGLDMSIDWENFFPPDKEFINPFQGFIDAALAALPAAEAVAREMARIFEKSMAAIQKYRDTAGAAIGAMDALFQQSTANRMIGLDNEYQRRRDHINASIADETARAQALDALDAEFAEKRKGPLRAVWLTSKAVAISNAIMSVYEAKAKALAQGGFFAGPIMMAITAALGWANVGLIAAQKMPLARGALFSKPTLLPARYEVAEAGSAEIVSPVPMMRSIVREELRALAGPSVTVNFNASLISTVGLSDADIRRAGAKVKDQVLYEMHRLGR